MPFKILVVNGIKLDRLNQLYSKLGFSTRNGLFLAEQHEEWFHKFPYRISRILRDVIKPAAFFSPYLNETTPDHPKPINQTFTFFFVNPTREQERLIHSRVINFAHTQSVYIVRELTIDLYHGSDFSPERQRLNPVVENGGLDSFNEYSFVNIITGRTLELLGKPKHSIDRYLLSNISDARRILVAKDGFNLNPTMANRLIGRLLFISYLIDRNVKFDDQDFLAGATKEERKSSFTQLILDKKKLYGFFKYLNKKYDGDMFPLKELSVKKSYSYDEESNVEIEHLDVLHGLFTGSKLFASNSKFKGYTVQKSLFPMYDFEIIPIELISSIYESFIGHQSENTNVRLTKQKAIKAYYTPAYLVDYVLSQTVTPFLNVTKSDDAVKCKVLDPSCGSGIFLVETARKLIEKEIAVTGSDVISDSRIWKLIKQNIFGIDIDSDAIDITVFSLYVTILDYKKPADIAKFKFQKLKDDNLFGGSDADFFNLEHDFNRIVKNLDFIIGNPPWGKVSSSRYLDYIKQRNEQEKKTSKDKRYIGIKIGSKEICQAFLLRTSDFKQGQTLKCCLVVSSKVLYNSQETARNFRHYFLSNYRIKQVVELSLVNNKIRGGTHIFDDARQPAAVLTFFPTKGLEDTSINEVEHITVKPNRFFLHYRTILIEKHDRKLIQQSYFMERMAGFDWLWKVLVHGNVLDVHFIRRLRSRSFDSVKNYLKKENFLYKGGLKEVDGKNKHDTTAINSFKYLDPDKGFTQYLMASQRTWRKYIESNTKIKDGKVGYLPELKYFSGQKLLIKKGVVLKPRPGEHYFGGVAGFDEGKYVFTSTICSIIPGIQTDESRLKLLALTAIFNSKFFTYFLFNSSSSAGIERSRVHFNEYFDLPTVYSSKLGELALKISEGMKEPMFDSTQLRSEIEKEIARIYNLSNIEKSLIDYCFDVSIPVLLRETKTAIFKKFDLSRKEQSTKFDKYVNAFKSVLSSRFELQGKYMKVQVMYSDFFVRVNYTLVSDESTAVEKTMVSNDNLEVMMGDLGIYRVCRDLYIQQDVRGFVDDGFYFIKPNERKLWHESVGYLDGLELNEAIATAAMNRASRKVQTT